jgi:hypothetical protein
LLWTQAAQQLRDECHAFLLSQLPASTHADAEVAAGHMPPQGHNENGSMQIDDIGVQSL